MIRRPAVCLCAALLVGGLACRESLPDSTPSKAQLRKSLLAAVRDDNVSDVRKLLDQGADANVTEEGTHYLDTALTLACKHGHAAIVDALLAKGANPNRRAGDFSSLERTPLMIAAFIGRVDIANALLRAGAHPDARAGLLHAQEGQDVGVSSALSEAASRGHADVVLLLIFAGARIERADLEVAIVTGHVDVVRVLLRAGADPRWTLRDGRTVLQTAESSPQESRAAMVALVRRFLNPVEPKLQYQ